ncbi:DUF2398 family protein [Nocardiopsis composta]|uniref:Uncharacterized protein (TIGR02678 family) n=1 Tax=Nocardiopsis composta TaxID=157465 RepID=A0A7W8VEH5_9ACTN|nr:DUF2398 family protein [Nocardiopsis composta]MBB5433088.1 uncharacterized protein (TIGR02678 family) [Nocardiopsis composta]
MLIDDVALIGERRAAARRLLATPFVTARTDPEAFALIRAHSDWLVQRFRRVLGYELTVGAEYARLAKAGRVRGAAPARRASGAPFTPRGYAYLALSLAVLAEGTEEEVPVDALAAGVRDAAREAGLRADPAERAAERRAFTAALRLLADWGVLAESKGALEDYAAGEGEEVRLTVDRELAALAVAHPPHAAADPDSFVRDAAPGDFDDDAAGEVALRRLLAEEAVVYREDLPERQRGRLARHQWRAAAELADLLGCETEVRAEGAALILPDEADGAGEVPGPLLPAAGPAAEAALLLVRRLAARIRPENTPAHEAPVPPEVLAEELAAVVGADSAHRRRWERGTAEYLPDEGELGRRALDLLAAAGLVRDRGAAAGAGGGWALRAAAARFAPVENRDEV